MSTARSPQPPAPKKKRIRSKQKSTARGKPLSIDLALQGGGSHGAFTWGVLDRLLEEEDIDIQGISGTSAGAMNGAMLVCGMELGGRPGAQKLLRELWESIAEIGALYQPFQPMMEKIEEAWAPFDPFAMFRLSPAQLNPFHVNPLRDLLTRLIDIEALRSSKHMQLFVTATNVHTGQARVFQCHEVTIDALMASACLPFVFEPVQIDGVPYWDGGYVGNPVIWPLIYNTRASDILLVQINPLVRETTPVSMSDIVNRLNEITFNASLVSEMRAIRFVINLMRENKLDENHYKHILMHRINMHDVVGNINASSKDDTDIDFLRSLHANGREAAENWLRDHKQDIGVRETIDINDTFLAPRPTRQTRRTTSTGDKEVDALAAPKLSGGDRPG